MKIIIFIYLLIIGNVFSYSFSSSFNYGKSNCSIATVTETGANSRIKLTGGDNYGVSLLMNMEELMRLSGLDLGISLFYTCFYNEEFKKFDIATFAFDAKFHLKDYEMAKIYMGVNTGYTMILKNEFLHLYIGPVVEKPEGAESKNPTFIRLYLGSQISILDIYLYCCFINLGNKEYSETVESGQSKTRFSSLYGINFGASF